DPWQVPGEPRPLRRDHQGEGGSARRDRRLRRGVQVRRSGTLKAANPWTPSADLSSAFGLSFLILFVDAALRVGWLAQEAEREREARAQAEQARVEEETAAREQMFGQVEQALRPYEDSGIVRVRSEAMTVELTDVSFASGSACLDPRA